MEEEKYSLLGVEMPFEEFDKLLCEQSKGKELKVIDGKVVAEYHIPTEEETMELLRSRRILLLSAFDKWEKAVMRGREEDSESIMTWYYDLLDLKESVFADIPERIQYYL